jgi:protein MpaA
VVGAPVLSLALVGCGGGGIDSPTAAERSASAAAPRATTVRRAAPGATIRRTSTFGRSAGGRPLRVIGLGNRSSARSVLVVGCIHGDECAGTAVTRHLLRGAPSRASMLWIVPNLNPDGRAAGTRLNGRGVDLNRNFPSEWRPFQRRGDPQYSGPRPLSEPESRAIARLIRARRPRITIWFHQPQAIVRAWGPSIPAARRYARLADVPFRRIRWPNGTASNWQNHRFPGTSSFVVELPAGELDGIAARRYAAATRELVTTLSTRRTVVGNAG